MMKRSPALASALLASSFAFLSASSLDAQRVVISEIEFTSRTDGQWIELANLGTQNADLTGWSLYQATLTQNKAQNYWWGFPRGTTIAPGEFLRVHWLKAVRTPPPAGSIDTGNTVHHFLFGLFAEPLDVQRGALALFNTQSNAQVNDREKIQDWVSWGTTGFKREDLAIQNNRWKANSFAPTATTSPTPTLAYDYTSPLGVHEGSFWFRDNTPTPGADNLGGAVVSVYGTSCQGNLTALAQQEVNGKPISGNRDFYTGIDRPLATTEFPLALLGARGDGSLKLFGCPYWLDTTNPAVVILVQKAGTVGRLNFGSLDPKLLEGLQFSMFWCVADFANDRLGFTNGVQLKFGK